MVAHSRDLRKNKKNKRNNTIKPCLGQTCAGRGSRPRSKSVVFLPLFLSPCGGTLTRSEGGKKKRNIETMSGPDLCRPRQQTFFKIVGLFCVVVFVLFFLFFPLFLSPCGGTLMISEEKSKTKQNKNNNQVKPCLGQTCAGRGSRPLSKSLVLFFVFFFFLFLSPCGGTLTGALVSKSLSTAEFS